MAIQFSQNINNAQQNALIQQFCDFQHPSLQRDLIKLSAVKKIEKIDQQLNIKLSLPFAWNTAFAQLKAELSQKLMAIVAAEQIEWDLHYQIATLKRANQRPAVNGVKNIIAVSSGKGGVGKSTTAVNLALALQQQGAKVGILDADIYGPSIPHMLGATNERPTSPDNKHIQPIIAHGIASNSIGYLMDADNATIWRGPMASSALSQLLNETLWKDLDYLVIDMPPGTGDIQLTLSQQIPVTAALVVTTPQDIALLDAIKGISMFNKVSIPVLGVIENMSVHICANCGHHETIFGTGGAEKIAKRYHTKVLGQLPLHICLREDLDQGVPTVISGSNEEIRQAYLQLAEKVATEMYWQGEVVLDDILIRQVM